MKTPSNQQRTFFRRHWFECCCVLTAIALVASAIVHQSMIHELDRYRSGPLIVFEMLALISTITATIALLVRTIIHAISGDKRYTSRFATLGLLIGAIAFSIWFDAATFLYAT